VLLDETADDCRLCVGSDDGVVRIWRGTHLNDGSAFNPTEALAAGR
jgi:hypothetical protein